MFAQAIQD